MTSLLTIGMPVYNDSDFIEKSLNSILNHTIKDFILIISDDGFTDGSQEICEKYTKKDYRIKYIRQTSFASLHKHYMSFLLYSFASFPKNLGDAKWGTIFFFRRLLNIQ